MQRSIVCCTLLILAVGAVGDESASLSFARSWMTSHADPQPDELADLKTANPEAYGLVKALLMKQQMGILNMHAPSKPISAGGSEAQSQPAPANIGLGWKPSDSALDDGPAPSSGGGGVITKMAADGAALDVDSSSDSSAGTAKSSSNEWGSIVSGESKPAPKDEGWGSIVAASTTASPAGTTAVENVYLKQMEDNPQPQKKDSSFLKRKERQGVKIEDGQDALASFSFDDDGAPTTPKPAATTTPVSSLDAFLGNTPTQKPVSATRSKAAAAEERLSDFSFDDDQKKPAHKDNLMQEDDDSEEQTSQSDDSEKQVAATTANPYAGFLD